MPFVSVTRLRLRSIRVLPVFGLHVFRTLRQAKGSAGFRGGSLMAGRWWPFWTLTAWDGRAGMLAYMTGGPHRAAMPFLPDWCDEASVVHCEQDGEALPGWAEADRRMRAEGRPSKVRGPSPDHAALTYRAPRVAAAGPVRPAGR